MFNKHAASIAFNTNLHVAGVQEHKPTRRGQPTAVMGRQKQPSKDMISALGTGADLVFTAKRVIQRRFDDKGAVAARSTFIPRTDNQKQTEAAKTVQDSDAEPQRCKATALKPSRCL